MTIRGFLFRLLGVGWFVALCIVGGAFGGYLLDNELNTKPIFSLLFLTAGTVFAMYTVWRWLSPAVKMPRKRQKGKKEQH